MASGAQLLVQLKANQPRLLRAMRAQAQQRPPADHARSHDIRRHNRIERREMRVRALAAGSGPDPWHDHFLSLIEVCRATEVFDTARRRFVARRETPAYYLSTLGTEEVAACEFARLVREHRAIENRLLHVLDVTLAEDATSRIRRNPGVFAGLRHLGLNLMCSNGETNISQAIYRNSLSLGRVLRYAGVQEQ